MFVLAHGPKPQKSHVLAQKHCPAEMKQHAMEEKLGIVEQSTNLTKEMFRQIDTFEPNKQANSKIKGLPYCP